MQITRVLSFAGLLLPCLANPIEQPAALADAAQTEAAGAPKLAPYEGKSKICKHLGGLIPAKWSTHDLDAAVCHSVRRADRARKDWEIVIPNSKIFDQIPEVHHALDCGNRLRAEVKGPGWRLTECKLNDNGTATIKMRSYLTASRKSVDKAIQRATCGAMPKFPKCFQSSKYIFNGSD